VKTDHSVIDLGERDESPTTGSGSGSGIGSGRDFVDGSVASSPTATSAPKSVKMLILGTSDSGKTSFFSQVALQHRLDLEPRDELFISVARQDFLRSFFYLLDLIMAEDKQVPKDI
jgi:hypothetical protein